MERTGLNGCRPERDLGTRGLLREWRTMMRMQRIVGFTLFVTLLAGCATHTGPTPLDAGVPDADDETGSIAANIWYVPGRGLVCGLGALSAGAVLTLTLGQSYEEASQIMHGGCSGPWVLHPSDLRQPVP